MPATEVLIFKNAKEEAPLIDWLDDQIAKTQDKITARIERLAEAGHELRRPEADYLRDDIYELRIKHLKVNYRVLYFFHEHKAILSHGFTKEDIVPSVEIDEAIKNKKLFVKNPTQHTYVAEEEDQKEEKE